MTAMRVLRIRLSTSICFSPIPLTCPPAWRSRWLHMRVSRGSWYSAAARSTCIAAPAQINARPVTYGYRFKMGNIARSRKQESFSRSIQNPSPRHTFKGFEEEFESYIFSLHPCSRLERSKISKKHNCRVSGFKTKGSVPSFDPSHLAEPPVGQKPRIQISCHNITSLTSLRIVQDFQSPA